MGLFSHFFSRAAALLHEQFSYSFRPLPCVSTLFWLRACIPFPNGGIFRVILFTGTHKSIEKSCASFFFLVLFSWCNRFPDAGAFGGNVLNIVFRRDASERAE